MLLVEDLLLPNNKLITLEVRSQEDLILRGKNGSGKSLLLKSLAYLYPLKFKTFTFKDRPLQKWRPQEFRSEILYVHPSYPKENLVVEDYLSHPFKLEIYRGLTPALNTKAYTDRWGISGLEISHLSMGQRQLLTLLRSVSLKAQVLLFDEPFANLDQDKTTEAETLIQEWKKRTGGSFILVSHDDAQSLRLQVKEVLLDELASKGP